MQKNNIFRNSIFCAFDIIFVKPYYNFNNSETIIFLENN